jgi:hypothetical protein
MKINGSTDITNLIVQVIFDISGTTPQILLTNLSTGDHLDECVYWFQVYSPSNTPIHEGSASNQDETGIWADAILADAWPRPFNQIEWSGNVYSFQAFVKDGDGNIYAGDIQTASICRPNGNLPTSKNTYGLGSLLVQTKCDQARIYFQDTTNTSYKGLSGIVGSSALRVNFPMDDTGNVPAPFAINYFSVALVPITYSGKGYQFLYISIWGYDFGGNVLVRIKYLFNDTFGVWCNIDLMPLVCEFEKLSQSISNGTCADAQRAQNQMNLIAPLMFKCWIGIYQPLTGVDVPDVIEEIKEIGGFDCDCCNVASGIIPTGSSAFDGYTFQIISQGGDIGGSVGVSGYNIQFLLHDVKYIVKICDGSPSETTAFNFIPSVSGDGYTKTYCLSIDVTQFGYDLGNAISSNPSLLNFWKSILSSSGGDFDLIVDGSCIFSSSSTCDYTFTLSNIPINTTYALLTGIKIGNINISLSYSFNLTNLTGLQAYLNGLGYGIFAVSNPSGQTVLITSNTNPNDIQQLTYLISSTNHIASSTKNCTGYVPISANEVVQKIINYICSLDDSEIKTSEQYEICYINPTSGQQQTSIILAGQSLTTFISNLLARGCDTINYVKSLGAINCASITSQFPTSSQVMQPNDIFLGTKAGLCARVLPTEAFLYMLTYGQFDSNVLAAFCNLVNLCSGGNPCAPYNVFNVVIDAGSPASDNIDLIVTFNHPDAISNTIRYARIDNTDTPVYTTISAILPGASPYTISTSPALENGQYRVYIRPVYADGRLCSETLFDTPACTGINSFSASYDGSNINVTYNAVGSLEAVKVNIAYPNGGSFSQIYTNGDPIVITPPNGVFGNYYITMQPVCDQDTGFIGVATAPVVVNIFNATVIVQAISPDGGSVKRITGVVGISGFTLSGNIESGNSQTGTHDAFTGAITVAIQQTASIANKVTLSINGSEVECIDVNSGAIAPQNHTFSSFSFLVTDIITISYDAGMCDSSPSINYLLSASYNLSIDAVSGSGIPSLPPTGVNGHESGEQTGMSGSYGVTLSGSVVTTTKLDAIVNGVVVDCVPVPSAGVYTLDITASGSDIVQIAVDSGPC